MALEFWGEPGLHSISTRALAVHAARSRQPYAPRLGQKAKFNLSSARGESRASLEPALALLANTYYNTVLSILEILMKSEDILSVSQ